MKPNKRGHGKAASLSENERREIKMEEKKSAFDLSELDTTKISNEGFDVELYHPATNVGLGIVIRVLGRDSDEFRKVSNAQIKRRTERFNRGGFRQPAITPEELEQNTIEILAACTVGWSGVVVDGKEIPFSKDNAKMLYTRFPWIREQIDAAIGDRANFMRI